MTSNPLRTIFEKAVRRPERLRPENCEPEPGASTGASLARFRFGILLFGVVGFLSSQGSAIAQGTMVNGGNYTGAITSVDQVDLWTFNATASDAISVSISEVGANTSFVPWIRIHGPTGANIGPANGSSGNLFAAIDFTAPLTGTYTVLAARFDTAVGVGQYLLTLAQAPGAFIVPAGDEGGPMTNGGNYSGTILRGDLDQWTFNATASDAISVGISEVGANTPFHPWIRVHGPNGANIGPANGSEGDLRAAINFTAPLTGTYTVLVARFEGADGAGQYLLTLAQAPGAFIVPAGDEGGPMTNGGNYSGTILRGDLDQWTFNATASDAISVGISEVGANTLFHPWIRIHGPNGANIGPANGSEGDLRGAINFTAPLTGTYTVLAADFEGADGAGQYLLTLAQAPGAFIVPAGDEGGPMTNGGNYSGTILRGDLDQWTFNATASDAISVGISEVGANTLFHPWIRIHGPTGANIGPANGSEGDLFAAINFTAPLTGTYTVLAADFEGADGAGQYLLTLAQAPGAFIVPAGDDGGGLTIGANPPGTILRGDLDQWRFDAVTGDAVSISISEVGANTLFHPWIRIHGPNGANIGPANGSEGDLSAAINFTAPLTGIYTVLVARFDFSDGTGTYQITSSHGFHGCVPPASPSASNNGPICAGETLQLTASTVAGATYAWTGPNGFTSALQNPSIPNATAAASGTYSVTATVAGCTSLAGTTNATVNVCAPAAAGTLLPDGRAVTQTLPAGGHAHRATVVAARSYSVEVDVPFNGATTVGTGGPLPGLAVFRADGTTALTTAAASRTTCGPATANRLTFTPSAADVAGGPLQIQVVDSFADGYKYRIRLEETTLFCTRWSINGYSAFIDLQNTSDCPVSGNVILLDSSASLVSVLPFTLAPASATQINVPGALPVIVGSAFLTHDGAQGTVTGGVYVTQPGGTGGANFRWSFVPVRAYGATDGL